MPIDKSPYTLSVFYFAQKTSLKRLMRLEIRLAIHFNHDFASLMFHESKQFLKVNLKC